MFGVIPSLYCNIVGTIGRPPPPHPHTHTELNLKFTLTPTPTTLEPHPHLPPPTRQIPKFHELEYDVHYLVAFFFVRRF
jgi:hypothetical protein